MRRATPRARERRAARVERDATSSDDDDDDDAPRVDDLLVPSSSDDEDEDEGDDDGGETTREATRDVGTMPLSLSRSIGDASDAAVRVLVRRVSRRAEASAADEDDEDDASADDANEDESEEDGLAIAAMREARLLAGERGKSEVGTSTADDARDEARRALRALRARTEKNRTVGTAASAGGVVDLVNVERVTNAMMDTVDAGRAMCCALGPGERVAVGTEGGFIFLERGVNDERTVSCLKSANTFAGISATPGVTSLCFDERGEWLLVGHDDGGLTLWDIKRTPTILKTIVGAHRTPVIALVMLSKVESNGVVDVISSEEGGLVIHHTLSPLGMGVVRVKSASLGERTFVIAAHALPRVGSVSVSDINAHDNGIISPTYGETLSAAKNIADAAGVAALCTMNAVLIMRLNPRAEVIAKIVRPPNIAATVLPVMCWSPRWVDEVTTHDNVEECNLVVVWGASVYVLSVDVESIKRSPGENERTKRAANTSRILNSWSIDPEGVVASAMATAWLSQDLICVLSSRNKLFVYTSHGQLIERVATSEPPIAREIVQATANHDAVFERLPYWHGSVAVRGVHFAMLSPSRLRRGKFFGWFERMQAKKAEGNWVGTLNTLIEVASDELPLWPSLSKKYADPETTRERAVQAFVDVVPQFLDESLNTRGIDSDDAAYFELITSVVFGLLLAFNALNQVYAPVVFGAFLNSKCKAAFLKGMVPHILSDKLRSLPAEVMQALVEHYAALDAANVIEQCVLHMDVESLDLNQVARLCKHHGMYSALAHVFTRALNDFITPVEAMFQASLEPKFGDKARVRQVLLFIFKTIQGEQFPTNGCRLSSEIVSQFRMEVMKFLFEPVDLNVFTMSTHDSESSLSTTWNAAMALAVREDDSSCPPLRLLYLLLAEPKASTVVLTEILKDWDASESEILAIDGLPTDRMGSQVIVEAVVFAAGACGPVNSAPTRSRLLTFAASIVGTGRATVTQQVERELLETLALAKTKHDVIEREKAMVSIIGRRIDEDITLNDECQILNLAREAHFAQAEAVIYIASGDHINALKALAGDEHRRNAAVHYVDVCLGKSGPGIVHAEQMNAGPAVARAHPLDTESAKVFQNELLAIMPVVAAKSADVCARIAIAYFPHAQAEVLNALSSEPVLQFQYLRQVLEAVHEVKDGVGSPHDMSLVDLVSATKSVVTTEMAELYFRLMCQFEPQDVLKYLKSEDVKSLDEARCLEYCREFNVMDATAYLLEAAGNYNEALSIHLCNYSTGIRAMAQLFTTSGAEWTKTAPAESLMKGFVIETNEALHVAVGMCRRVSSEVSNSEEMWWSCLDSVFRSLLELTDGAYKRVRDVLDEHLEDVLRVMLGRVDNAHLLEMIISRYGGRDISALRKLLTRVFGNCALEREFLKSEGSSVKQEADKKVLEDFQIRRRAQRGTRRTVR